MQVPFLESVRAAGGELSGVAVTITTPPDQQLSERALAGLDELSRVVNDVPEPPVSPRYRLQRMECATLYLAIGDDRGIPIRVAVWERVNRSWQHRSQVKEFAQSSGATEAEFVSWSQHDPQLIPVWRDPVIQELVRFNADGEEWVPWWDLADIVETRAS